MHALILTWNAILSGAFESPTDDIALGRRSKARDDATKFGNGGSEKDKARSWHNTRKRKPKR